MHNSMRKHFEGILAPLEKGIGGLVSRKQSRRGLCDSCENRKGEDELAYAYCRRVQAARVKNRVPFLDLSRATGIKFLRLVDIFFGRSEPTKTERLAICHALKIRGE